MFESAQRTLTCTVLGADIGLSNWANNNKLTTIWLDDLSYGWFMDLSVSGDL